jgi:cob(I)alamin adenosyltransferase
MVPREKYDLAKILSEIEDDIHEQARDLSQVKDIPQDVITNLMLERLRNRKKTTSPDASDGHEPAQN